MSTGLEQQTAAGNDNTPSWQESVTFRFDDWGWIVINLGMGIGAGIAFLPVEVGIKGFWVFMLASLIGYPAMFLFQRLYVNTLSEAESCKEYSEIITEYLGEKWGTFLGVLYFIMMVIWFFVYSETVTKDSASYLQTFGVTSIDLAGNPLYIVAVLAVLIFIASMGEKLLFKLSSVLAMTVLFTILLLAFSMIPQWSWSNINASPGPMLFAKDTVVTLPFVLTSILFLQSLSPMVTYFKKNSASKAAARYRGQRAMTLAFIILFTIVFFYALSFTFSLSYEQANQAYKENISALAAAAKGHSSTFNRILEVMLDIFAVCACFLSVFLGLQEATKSLFLNIRKRFKNSGEVNETYLKWGIALFLLIIGTVNALINVPILYFTLICSPIFGIIGCLIPAYLVYKVPSLHQFRGIQLYIIIAMGILLCIAPILAML